MAGRSGRPQSFATVSTVNLVRGSARRVAYFGFLLHRLLFPALALTLGISVHRVNAQVSVFFISGEQRPFKQQFSQTGVWGNHRISTSHFVILDSPFTEVRSRNRYNEILYRLLYFLLFFSERLMDGFDHDTELREKSNERPDRNKGIVKRQQQRSLPRRPISSVLAAVTLAGGPSEAARRLGVTPQTVHTWLKRGRLVSEKTFQHARRLSETSGVEIGQLLSGIVGKRKL